MKENYPKYIIPYTPICLAVIITVLLMPLFMKLFRRNSFACASVFSIAIFFLFETLFEQKVVVTAAETVAKLEDWQMFMCYIPPESLKTTYKTQTAVDILIGNYDPAFKVHFYVISAVLILSVLNCIYGFGKIIKTGEKKRMRSLILQTVSALLFLGLCILACFTAFWRDGNLEVSALSAILMSIFFILFGITAGIFTGSFLLGKSEFVSVCIPSFTAAFMTLLMYIGEMILLNRHLYTFGTGFIFRSIPGIVLAPIDILIILTSTAVTSAVFMILNQKSSR